MRTNTSGNPSERYAAEVVSLDRDQDDMSASRTGRLSRVERERRGA